jgi:hypothetical protein
MRASEQQPEMTGCRLTDIGQDALVVLGKALRFVEEEYMTSPGGGRECGAAASLHTAVASRNDPGMIELPGPRAWPNSLHGTVCPRSEGCRQAPTRNTRVSDRQDRVCAGVIAATVERDVIPVGWLPILRRTGRRSRSNDGGPPPCRCRAQCPAAPWTITGLVAHVARHCPACRRRERSLGRPCALR